MTAAERPITDHAAPDESGELPVERLDDRAARELAERLEVLLARLETLPDQPARSLAAETVESVVRLYGEGLARIVDRLARGTDGALMPALAQDELVSHLLLLHDLHPDAVSVRVGHALDDLRPSLQSHGVDAELIDVNSDVARVRITRSGHGCASTSQTLSGMVTDAVLQAAPELVRVQVEQVATTPTPLVAIGRRRMTSEASRAAGERSPAAGTPPHQPS